MARTLVLIALAFSLTALPASAAYLQVGVDAARTGASSDAGPEWPDVALRVQLPGNRALGSAPLVRDGLVYIGVNVGTDGNFSGRADARSAVWTIDLATGASHPFLESDRALAAIAIHDDMLLVTRGLPEDWPTADGGFEIAAHSLTDARPLWSREFVVGDFRGACLALAAREDTIYGGCFAGEFSPLLPVGEAAGDAAPFTRIVRFDAHVVAVSAATGEERWRWHKGAAAEQSNSTVPQGVTGAAAPAPSTRYSSVLLGLSVNGPYVHATTVEGPTRDGVSPGFVWTLEAATGRFLNGRVGAQSPGDARQYDPFIKGLGGQFTFPATPTGDGSVAYMKLGQDILAVNPSRDVVIWRVPVGERDTVNGQVGSGFALAGPVLYASSLQTLYRIDTETLERLEVSLPADRAERWSPSGIVHAGRLVYARAQEDTDQITRNAFYAFDADSLAEVWRYEVEFPPVDILNAGLAGVTPVEYEYSVADGVMVVASYDGNVTVLGRTAASPRPSAAVSEEYPEAGESVEVDVSGSTGGAGGPPTGFAADWGDGSVTDWQSDPVLRHAYAEPGERTARFFVRNAAGQSASETATFHVGEPAPNLLSTAFARENQDVTLFAVGLAATAIGGAVGLARLERRRGRLKRELAAIDTAYQRTRDRPAACEAALAERRARVSGLLVDGKLDDTQAIVLERRLDELSRTLRTHELGDLLDRLPRRLARAAEEMLADGRVSGFERDGFLALLDADEVLDAGTKERVRRIVEEWAARDRAPGGGG